MAHVVLLGDSIFDNSAYVPDGHAVIEHLRAILPEEWSVSLLAVDGHVTSDVKTQLEKVPNDATHFIVSCGGNDALNYLPTLTEQTQSVAEALDRFARIRADFRDKYRSMLEQVVAISQDVTVCTVYDCVPDLEPMAHAALSMFNEVILREAISAKVAVIDLRLVCTERSDYSKVSPIEPSHSGGEKIANIICSLLLGDVSPDRVVAVYT